jgi:hypothetical protein
LLFLKTKAYFRSIIIFYIGGKVTAISSLDGLTSITSRARLRSSGSLLVGGGAGHLERTGPRDEDIDDGVAEEKATTTWPTDAEIISELDRAWTDSLEELNEVLGGVARPSDIIKGFDLKNCNFLSTVRFRDQLKKSSSAMNRKESTAQEEVKEEEDSRSKLWREEEEEEEDEEVVVEELAQSEGRVSMLRYHSLIDTMRRTFIEEDEEDDGEDNEASRGEEKGHAKHRQDVGVVVGRRTQEGTRTAMASSSEESNRADTERGINNDERRRQPTNSVTPEGQAKVLRVLHEGIRYLNSLRGRRSRERLKRFQLPQIDELMRSISATALGNISSTSLLVYDEREEEDGDYIKLGDVVAGLYEDDVGGYFVDYTKVSMYVAEHA